jgi:hypothetical protein
MSSNNDCSAHNRPREYKLISIEFPGNEESEDVFKIVPTYL